MKKFFSFLVLTLFLSQAQATNQTERVGSIIFNKGKIEKIYLASGLGSVLIFPCPVDEAFLGRSSEITVLTSPKTKRNILLSVKSSFSEATNLIVRCEEQTAPFVFDLVPSRARHQDVVHIRSSFGSPALSESDLKLIDSSDFNTSASDTKAPATPLKSAIIISKPALIAEGETK